MVIHPADLAVVVPQLGEVALDQIQRGDSAGDAGDVRRHDGHEIGVVDLVEIGGVDGPPGPLAGRGQEPAGRYRRATTAEVATREGDGSLARRRSRERGEEGAVLMVELIGPQRE